MGVYADDFFELDFGSNDTVGSRWCKSRSQLSLGLRTVRIDRPFIGLRIPSRLLCQVPVRVVTPVDWYGVVVDRGLDNSGSGLGARWWARLIGQQSSDGDEGLTDLVDDGWLKAAGMVGGRLNREGGCLKSGAVGFRFEWKWRRWRWRWRWRRSYGLVGRCATEVAMVAKEMLKVWDEWDTWQREGDSYMGSTSRGSTWESSGSRVGPTLTVLLDCWMHKNIFWNARTWVLHGGKLVADSRLKLTILFNETLHFGSVQEFPRGKRGLSLLFRNTLRFGVTISGD
ncbi:hypothetical protein V6N13_057452 [Hibiscus sabdariffa]